MKKILMIAALLGIYNVSAITPAQVRAGVQKVVNQLKQDPTQAKKLCPQVCNAFAEQMAPEIACGLCYETCKAQADPKRKKILAQRMMRTCTEKNYPAKCCEFISTGCVQKDIRIKELEKKVKSDEGMKRISAGVLKSLRNEMKERGGKLKTKKKALAYLKKILVNVELKKACQAFFKMKQNELQKIVDYYNKLAGLVFRMPSAGDKYTTTLAVKKAVDQHLEAVKNIITEIEAFEATRAIQSCNAAIKIVFREMDVIKNIIQHGLSPLFASIGEELDIDKFTKNAIQLEKLIEKLKERVQTLADIGILEKKFKTSEPEVIVEPKEKAEIVEYPTGGTIIIRGQATVVPEGGTVILHQNTVTIINPRGSISSKNVTSPEMAKLLEMVKKYKNNV